MEKDINTKQIEFVKPPFFKAGSLRFASSGHDLVLSGRNYRCSLSCRGSCKEKEPQPNKEKIERNFSRYALKFRFEGGKKFEEFTLGLIRNVLHGMIDSKDWGEDIQLGEEIDERLDMMKDELKSTGNILEEDINKIENNYAKLSAVNPQLLLIAVMIGVLKSFSEIENEMDMGRELAILCKRIYITDTGKIKEILLERWGWYILNYIDKNISSYIAGLEKKGIKITNKKDDEILSLDLKDAVKYFDKNNFDDALHSYGTNFFYNLFSMSKIFIDPIVQGKTNFEQRESLAKGFQQLTSPLFSSLAQLMQISGAKVRIKRQRKREGK